MLFNDPNLWDRVFRIWFPTRQYTPSYVVPGVRKTLGIVPSLTDANNPIPSRVALPHVQKRNHRDC